MSFFREAESGGRHLRVLRGGSWNNNGRNCRSANRNRNGPGNRNNNIGFRVVVSASTLHGQSRRKGLRPSVQEESSASSGEASNRFRKSSEPAPAGSASEGWRGSH
ncbi:MAG: SUMF1/EgtB/PvdO family nonheme iron enzyme [Blastocatellia bacterium]